jgi:hypothetical protein
MSEVDQENIRAESNELLKGNVETMESHKSRDPNLAENQRDGVCTER